MPVMRRYPPIAIALACAAFAGATFGCAKGAASPRDSAATAAVAHGDPAAAPGAAPNAAPNTAPPRDSIVEAADRGRILGSESAPVWFLIVSDFQCPYCKAWHDSTFHALEKEYVETGKIRMAYINYPIPQHANAVPAAVTAMCASAQGKFWQLQDRIFDTQDAWKTLAQPRPYLDSLAVASGADPARLRACESGNHVEPLIEADQSRFERAGVQGTPTFFIGSAQLVGALPIRDFRHVIDSVLAATHAGK
jgi:protein-disulfide isomerase